MLNLKEFEVIKREANEHYYRFTIEAKERPIHCTHCYWDELLEENDKFIVHSSKQREVSDMPIHGKPVKLVLIHKRFKCPCCGKTFYQPFLDIEKNCKVTLRLKEYIRKESLKKPFSQIAYEVDLSPTIVKKYFNEEVHLLDLRRTLKAPRVLGIDEAHLNKKMRGVFTDTENNKLIEITADNLKRTVKETIKAMEGYKNIEVVTIDMYSGYRYACQELIPNAIVVVDKFHVVQYAIRALETVRKDIKKSLPKLEQKKLTYDRWILLKNREDLSEHERIKRDEWFFDFPQLAKAYWLKEGIRDIYKCETKDEAILKFEKWKESIPSDFKPFLDVSKTYTNHKKEIFNYFDMPYTNAYTESVNNIIKMIEKQGKGYSYEVLRAKVLYGTTATKRPKFKKDMEFTMYFNELYDTDEIQQIEVDGFEIDINELENNLG